jgi:hypothetical protein
MAAAPFHVRGMEVGMDENELVNRNKAALIRFNQEVIENGNARSFQELMALDFVNCTAARGTPAGADGTRFMFEQVCAPRFPISMLRSTIKLPKVTR